MVHIFYPGTCEVETGGSPWDRGQPGQHGYKETVSQKKKKEKEEEEEEGVKRKLFQ